MLSPYAAFDTADGGLFLAVASDRQFRHVMGLLELPELIDDARFRTNADRVANRVELHRLIEDRLRQRPASEWEALLIAEGVPCSRVRTIADLAEDEQLEALGLLRKTPHPQVPDLRLVDVPLSRRDARSGLRFPPPELGQHSDEVLAEIGYDKKAIKELREDGVVR